MHQNPTRQQVAAARAASGDTGDPGKNPDYLIEGYVFDCYAPGGAKAVRGVWKETAGKVNEGQTQRVVIDLRSWSGDMDDLREQFDTWRISGLKELIAITPTGAITQLRHRH